MRIGTGIWLFWSLVVGATPPKPTSVALKKGHPVSVWPGPLTRAPKDSGRICAYFLRSLDLKGIAPTSGDLPTAVQRYLDFVHWGIANRIFHAANFADWFANREVRMDIPGQRASYLNPLVQGFAELYWLQNQLLTRALAEFSAGQLKRVLAASVKNRKLALPDARNEVLPTSDLSYVPTFESLPLRGVEPGNLSVSADGQTVWFGESGAGHPWDASFWRLDKKNDAWSVSAKVSMELDSSAAKKSAGRQLVPREPHRLSRILTQEWEPYVRHTLLPMGRVLGENLSPGGKGGLWFGTLGAKERHPFPEVHPDFWSLDGRYVVGSFSTNPNFQVIGGRRYTGGTAGYQRYLLLDLEKGTQKELRPPDHSSTLINYESLLSQIPRVAFKTSCGVYFNPADSGAWWRSMRLTDSITELKYVSRWPLRFRWLNREIGTRSLPSPDGTYFARLTREGRLAIVDLVDGRSVLESRFASPLVGWSWDLQSQRFFLLDAEGRLSTVSLPPISRSRPRYLSPEDLEGLSEFEQAELKESHLQYER